MPLRNHQRLTRDEAWEMLRFIPAHDRGDWIKVGMALKSEFGDSGFPLFEQWSQSAENYDQQAVKAVWRSFKNGPVTIGSLIHIATEHGWRSHGTGMKSPPQITQAPKPVTSNTKSYALQLWLAANNADATVAGHQYAINKGIDWAAGVGRGVASGSLIGRDADCIIVPIRCIETDTVQGVQCINADGIKQTFGSVSGGALILGNTLDKSLHWYVAEGWATAVAMVFHHQNGNGVCAASFGKSNQQKVAELIDEYYKPKEVIILREQD